MLREQHDIAAPPRNNAAAEKDYLDVLNAEQRRAVEHGCEGSVNDGRALLIIAGAGSGKTNTLAYRVAHLVCRGADPRRILLLTFSRRAAAEMERRAGQILHRVLGLPGATEIAPLPWAGTFHSVGARLLREYAERIGLRDSFTIHDRTDSEDSLAIVRHELGLSATKNRFPGKATCLAIYSRVVNSQTALSEVLRSAFPWCAHWEEELRKLFAAYTAEKQAQNVLDYDDLLLYWAEVMKVSELAGVVRGLFDHVLVDEYQDTNALQAGILRGLKPDGAGLTVVGDDAQAIYGFRAADVRNILDFPDHFRPSARVVTLEENYRSTQPILAASNAVIGLARERFSKNLHSRRAGEEKPALVTVSDDVGQVSFIVESILSNREDGTPLKEQAVLFRTSHHSAMLEIELARRNIPFVKFGGLKFIEAAHVKDILAVLRWAENPADRVTGFRVLQILDGIGPATAGKVFEHMGGHPALAALATFAAPAKAASAWQELVALMGRLATAVTDWPSQFDLVRQWYQPHLEQRYADAVVRAGDIDQLQRIAAGYATRSHFLTELTLDPPSATSDEAGKPLLDEDYLILSTIHSAKGREWKAVFVLNVVDGCIPSDMSTGTAEDIEEERRLLYVAMTRAKDQLALVLPHRFYVHGQSRHGDKHVYASRTRFIPAGIIKEFEVKAWPPARLGATAAQSSEGASVDLPARLRGMWRRAG